MWRLSSLIKRAPRASQSVKEVPLSKILLGGENDLSGYKYALMADDLMRPSRLVSDGPHFRLLQSFLRLGRDVLQPEVLKTTDYYSNALQCIDLFGEYFPGIDRQERIALAAERFLSLYEGRDVSHLPSDGHSRDGELISVRCIKDSDCYQLIQGNHRVAFALARGQDKIQANILGDRLEITPIQFLLDLLRWEQGEKILYQPLPCPELESNWILARRCSDRLERMIGFIRAQLEDFEGSLLDLGSYYGWFVSEFRRRGFDAWGVEKDNVAITIGKIAYGNLDNAIVRDDIGRYLAECDRSFDIVCCLSVVHHFITGREPANATAMLNLIDTCTGKIFFFEMGQPHEQWFSSSLSGWTDEKIESWVLNNSSFKRCFRLGRDGDGVGSFEGNFGRTLFAFVR